MRRRTTTRALFHVGMLAALVAGAVSGVVMLASYFVVLVDLARGVLPVPDVTMTQVVLGMLMVLILDGSVLAGLGTLYRQCRHGVALAAWVERAVHAPESRLADALTEVRLTGWVVQVDEDVPYAFTYGILRPRIVVSTRLVAATTRDELVAVLHHEDFHRLHRDPLRVLVLRTWAAVFFLVPILGVLLRWVVERQELRADRAAVRACGVRPVAGALLKAVGQPAVGSGVGSGAAVAAMGTPALLAARVTQLETGRGPRLLGPLRPAVVLSSLPGIGLIAAFGVLMVQICMAVQVCCQ